MKTIIQKNLHRIARFYAMGPRIGLWIVYNRLKKRWFIHANKKRWLKGRSFHLWNEICLRQTIIPFLKIKLLYGPYGSIRWPFVLSARTARVSKDRPALTTNGPLIVTFSRNGIPPFEVFFKQLAAETCWEKMLNDPLFIPHLPTQNVIHQQADAIVRQEISLLGFGSHTFLDHNISWHQDFTTHNPSPTQWQHAFYNDIAIPAQSLEQSNQRLPDIKIPWELSRFHYFFILGMAYRQAIKEQDQHRAATYAHAFANYFNDWVEKNPYCQGVNWVNPMEVAIRSINLVWAFHLFKHEPSFDLNFWQCYVCVLNDHAAYLRHNWEVSDKPNNHYIADLVGYLYVNIFLGNSKRQHWASKALQNQLIKQILPDGTSYEGSTNYHILDTELFLHMHLLCKHANLDITLLLKEKLTEMMQFISACTDHGNNMVQIGDNDGGKIVTGTTAIHAAEQSFAQTYRNFGLTIIQTPRIHVTFRHPTYQAHQPTGHFHYDMLSWTLSIDNTPIIIDPGTYLYTAHPSLRNYLRSFAAHNTFYIEPDTFTQRSGNLFQLPRVPQPFGATVKKSDKKITIHDFYNHYQHIGLVAHRKLEFDQQKNTITVEDWWETGKKDKNLSAINFAWALHFAPGIDLEKEDSYSWTLKKDGLIIGAVHTSCEYALSPDFFSPIYGSLQQSVSLRAKTSHGNTHQYVGIQIS
jgi:hypothetical protein